MGSSKGGAAAVDDARREICDRFAGMIREGGLTVRVRLTRKGVVPSEARFAVHRGNQWHTEADVLTDAALLNAVWEEMEQVASRGHAEEWSARWDEAPDWVEVAVQFRAEKISAHAGEALPSLLMGMLFHSRHDSGQDRRRSIRRGPRAGH